MKGSKTKSTDAPALRQRAEQQLRRSPPPLDHALTGADLRALVHELQVHQIELEMQNEELLHSQAEAKAAADKYTELFDFAPVGYFVLDAKGVIRQANLAGAALLGLDRNATVGKPFEQHVTPDDRQKYEAFCRAVRKSETKQACDLRLLQHRLGLSDVFLEGTVANDAGAGGPGLRVAVFDITARKRAEASLQLAHAELEQRVLERTAELRQTNVELGDEIGEHQRAEDELRRTGLELERSNRELEEFARAASHDLQEPLRAVAGFTQLLQRRFPETLDAKAREFIKGAAEGAIRMQAQLHDLVGLAHVTSRITPFAPTDLNALLSQALDNLQGSLQAAHAQVTRNPLPTLSVDGPQIVQLFESLISNAIRFHSERPLQIHIGGRKEPGQWLFWVQDNGIGIKPEYFQRIFLVFQRLHTRKEYPGTGIGLAICKKIVERHGGNIWVESKPGEGSAFYFSIPANPADAR